jgi:hypothetical protein
MKRTALTYNAGSDTYTKTLHQLLLQQKRNSRIGFWSKDGNGDENLKI